MVVLWLLEGEDGKKKKKVYADGPVSWSKIIPVSNKQRRGRMVPSIDGNVAEVLQEDSG